MSSPLAELDAVTVDAAGTAVELVDPVPALRRELARRGCEYQESAVRRAFAGEVAHYLPRSLQGRSSAALAELRRECVGVFLAQLGAPVDPEGFLSAFMSAIVFRPVPGAREALGQLRRAGLSLACVANWDIGLHHQLERAGVSWAFSVVLSSAEVGVGKPSPAIFERALAALGIPPERALHIGDSPEDERGAAGVGIRFEPVPLATLPRRLGLR